MDGLINLNKPPGLTSAKALYRVRKITGQRKSGHAGTLDPAASGVLVICLGRGTKLVEQLMDQPKVYRATARLDVTSESYDSDRPLQAVEVAGTPDLEQVCAAASTFEGEILQVPPVVSAIKVGGQPAYKLARHGKVPRLEPRPARVYWLHVARYVWPEIQFSVACGRGTYVRAIIRDLGQCLGTGGCLTGLVREAVGWLRVEEAWSLEALEAARPDDYVCSLEKAGEELARRPIRIPPAPGA
ncbi:MAG: tRNA pseudouridine(55) synthase TruB [Phycisphaerae bacterium]|nr:tRNA pseudouridine(55) synthase TruB [Phycisphaerae bacterium]